MRRAIDGLKQVRVAAPSVACQDYPHQMSGGMKQRVVGAIAISCEPQVIIADEPTTSLDVTIQAQYLRLLREIQEDTNLALIFITHDFGIVAKMCDRVMVMYAGRVVESGPVRDIFNHPSHPYTQALLSSVPKHGRGRRAALFDHRPAARALGPPHRAAGLPPGAPMPTTGAGAQYPPSFTVGDGHTADCWRLEDAWTPSPSSALQGLKKHFPVTQGCSGRRSSAGSRPWTASASPFARARRWRWWASPAAARRRPPS